MQSEQVTPYRQPKNDLNDKETSSQFWEKMNRILYVPVIEASPIQQPFLSLKLDLSSIPSPVQQSVA